MPDYNYYRAKNNLKRTLSGKSDDILVLEQLEAARRRLIKSNARGLAFEKAHHDPAIIEISAVRDQRGSMAEIS